MLSESTIAPVTARRERPRSDCTRFALVALAYAPYQLLLASIFPIRVLGVSLMATVLPAALVLLVTLTVPNRIRADALNVSLLAAGGLVIVTALRRYLDISDVDVDELQTYRFVFLVPLWLRVMKVAMADRGARELASKLIVVNGIGAALTGLAYREGWLHVRLVFDQGSPIDDPLSGFVTRSSGFFGNPNLFGSMLLVTALLAVLVILPRSTTGGLAVLAIAGAGALTSGSRWAVIAIGVTSVAALGVRSRLNRSYTKGARLLLLILIAATAVPGVLALGDRFGEVGSSNRWEKNQVGFEALTQGPDTLLAGARPGDLFRSLTDERRIFSDNGWLQMPLSVGLPLALAVIVNSWRVVRAGRWQLPWASRIVLGLFVGTMLFNNANLWDPWILSTSCLFWIVTYDRAQPVADGAQRAAVPGPARASGG